MRKILSIIILFGAITSEVSLYASWWGLLDQKQRSEWSEPVIDAINKFHPNAPYFPGSWPLDDKKKTEKLRKKLVNKLQTLHCKVPASLKLFPENYLTADQKQLRPDVQLGFAVVCKWIPAFLLVRALIRHVTHTRKKDHHHRHR